MSEALNTRPSKFIATFRLKPERAFAGLRTQFITKDGYQFSFHDEMVWIGFDATPDMWTNRLQTATEALRTLVAILTIQTEYPFDLEPVQWIEDKPRDQTGVTSYVLGKLGPDLMIQKDIPPVTADHIGKGAIHAHLATLNRYYHYALLDYSISLSVPREAIVFCARSMEWVELYFDARNRLLAKREKVGARKLMTGLLKLPAKYVTRFFATANQTVIARHARDPGTIRAPTIEEIRFCVFFDRIVLDRFATYVWYSMSKDLPPRWAYPTGEKPPNELFEAANAGLAHLLEEVLRDKQ